MSNPKVCISYSGEDWTQAHRLKLWLEEAGLAPFFVSPVGEVLPSEDGPLTNLLDHTFSNAYLVLSLVPPRGGLSKWIELELNAAVTHAKRVIFIRTDAKRPRPPLPGGSNVRHYTLRSARERELVTRVKKELAASA